MECIVSCHFFQKQDRNAGYGVCGKCALFPVMVPACLLACLPVCLPAIKDAPYSNAHSLRCMKEAEIEKDGVCVWKRTVIMGDHMLGEGHSLLCSISHFSRRWLHFV